MVKGTIQALERKRGPRQWYWTVLMRNEDTKKDEWFTSFLNLSGYEVGDVVEYDVTVRERDDTKFYNITKIKRLQKRNEVLTKEKESVVKSVENTTLTNVLKDILHTQKLTSGSLNLIEKDLEDISNKLNHISAKLFTLETELRSIRFGMKESD